MSGIVERLRRQLFPFERLASEGELLFFRVFEALVCIWTIQFAWEWAPFIQRIKTVVLPLGVANYFDVSVFFEHGLSYVLAGAQTLFLVLGFLRRTKWAYAAAIVVFHLLYVTRYCLGEISHGTNLLGLAVLAWALGTLCFQRSTAHQMRFVFGFLVFFFGLGYSSAAVCKLVATGISWPSGDHLALWIGERTVDVTSNTGRFDMGTFQALALEHRWVGTLVLTFGLVSELVGMLGWVERLRVFVLSGLIIMHLGIDLMMNIYFGHNIYLIALLAYPWGRLFDWALAKFPRLRSLRLTGAPSALT